MLARRVIPTADSTDATSLDVLAKQLRRVASFDGMKTFSKDGLAICPAGDKDLFSVVSGTQNENVGLIVEFQNNGATLDVAILNAGGIPIATGTAVTGNVFKVRAFAQNLPAGQYYAQVAAAVSGTLTLNNYQLTLNVTGP